MTLAQISMRRPVTIIMVFVSMVTFGLVAARLLPLEFFPSLDAPFVGVQVPYPNSTPEEIEQNITRPLEQSLATIGGIDTMFSNSGSDSAFIGLFFGWGSETNHKSSEVQDRIDAVRAELPEDVQRTLLLRFSTSDQPVLRLRLASKSGDLRGAYELLTRKLKRPLERLPGVARVDLAGVEPYEVHIDLLPERIASHNISLFDLNTRLRDLNFSVSGGLISEGTTRYRVQPEGELRTLEELGNVRVNSTGVRLRDIAEIAERPREQDYRRVLNGTYAVGCDVYRERNANLVDVGRSAMAEIRRIIDSNELPGIELIVIDDQAEGVTSSLGELTHSGWLGVLLSMLVLYFFLRHWPSTIMVCLAIPVCITVTLGSMYFFGMSLNILSMMGLLLGVGMVVDNAVVVVESIYQQHERNPSDPRSSAIEGTRMVGLAVSAGTLTSIIVFLPNIFGGTNQVSIFLFHVAVALTIMLLASWLVAVSLIPMLAARIRPPKGLQAAPIVEKLKARYGRMLEWTLAHRKSTVWMIVGLLLSVAVPISLVKMDMFGGAETRELRGDFDMNGAYTLPEMERANTQFQQFLLSNKDRFEIDRVYTYIQEGQGLNFWVQLKPGVNSWFGQGSKSPEQILELIKKDMPSFAIGKPNFEGGRGPGGGGGQSDGKSDFTLRVVGDSVELLKPIADDVVRVLSQVKGLKDVRVDQGTSNTEARIRVDREKATSLGFSVQQVAQTVAIALRGTPLREFRTEEGEVPVWLRFKDAQNISFDTLEQVRMTRPDGSSVPLSALVAIETGSAAREIRREQRQTGLTILVNLEKNVEQSQARPLVDAALKSIAFPAGYGYNFGQSFDDDDEAGRDMVFNTLLALAMTFVVMAALFESMVYPLAILSCVLFAVVGVYWGFLLTGTTMSIMALIGMLILIGVVVNNGIILVEHINNLRREGMARAQAVVRAGEERLRPILITMGTTILGLLPLCFSNVQVGGDGPPYFPMARAIACGLFFSTFVSLLVLPTIYVLLDDAAIRFKAAFRKQWQRATGAKVVGQAG
jgi:HAE1 family hydrophobic/amphiphilic exporter-1